MRPRDQVPSSRSTHRSGPPGMARPAEPRGLWVMGPCTHCSLTAPWHCPFTSPGTGRRTEMESDQGREGSRGEDSVTVCGITRLSVTSVGSARPTGQRECPSASLCLSFPHKKIWSSSDGPGWPHLPHTGACPFLLEVQAPPGGSKERGGTSSPLNKSLSAGLSLQGSLG